MRHLTFIIILLIVCSRLFGQSGYYIPSERFSSGLINDVCQDKYGYIWVATENGLNKFDGYRFTQYLHQPNNPQSLNSNIVTKLGKCGANGGANAACAARDQNIIQIYSPRTSSKD